MAQARLGENPLLFSIGYEGHDIDSFVARLDQQGIKQLVDVRANPWSRKPAFSKGPLSEGLARAEIAYAHIGALGAPDKLRREAREHGGFQEGYTAHLAGQGAALTRLAELARTAPTAVMCLEKKPEDCHRSILCERFEQRGWSVVHL